MTQVQVCQLSSWNRACSGHREGVQDLGIIVEGQVPASLSTNVLFEHHNSGTLGVSLKSNRNFLASFARIISTSSSSLTFRTGGTSFRVLSRSDTINAFSDPDDRQYVRSFSSGGLFSFERKVKEENFIRCSLVI